MIKYIAITTLALLPFSANAISDNSTHCFDALTYTNPVLNEQFDTERVIEPGNELRYRYVTEVRAMKAKYDQMIQDLKDQDIYGDKNLEIIARAAQEERRMFGLAYKKATSKKALETIYKNNIRDYGDKYGPTIQYLTEEKNKSWSEIIESASRPGGARSWAMWAMTSASYYYGYAYHNSPDFSKHLSTLKNYDYNKAAEQIERSTSTTHFVNKYISK